jgi:hypothetical protein
MGTRVHRRLFGAACVVVALPLVAGACSDDDGGNETARVCDARNELASKVDDLEDVDVVANGTEAARNALDGVLAAVEELADASGDHLSDEVDAVRHDVDDVQAAVGSIGDQSAAGAAELIRDSVKNLADSTTVLVEEATATCG